MSKQSFIKIFKSERYLLIISILVISIVYLPYFISGEDSHIIIFDNLDSSLVWAKMVLDQGGLFMSPTAMVEQMMNGQPHSSVYETYDISLVCFHFFGMFWGYIANKFLMSMIALFGMYFLLKKHILSINIPLYIPVAVSVLFALIPFWSFSASVAGIPMAFFAFLNIRQGDVRAVNWSLLLLYAFYSSLILTGVFLLTVVSCIWLWDVIKHKSSNKYFLFSIIFLLLSYVVSHLPLVLSYICSGDYISHRIEFFYNGNGTIETLENFFYMLAIGDRPGSVPSLQVLMIFPILFVLFSMIRKKKINRLYTSIIIFIILTSVFYSVYDWWVVSDIKHALSRVLPIDLRRFFWLHPICWSVLLAMSLSYIYETYKKGYYFVIIILMIQSVFVLSQQPYFTNSNLPTYKEFFAEKQFSDIKSYIGKDVASYRVVSVCMHPSISQYNGFYTLDGFSRNYSLAYKHQFRKIIEGEFKRNFGIERFFDQWGSWCYAFTAEYGSDINHISTKKINQLDYNFQVFKEMGGQYIISAVEIDTINNSKLQLMQVFDNYPDSHWVIYLYQVN